MGLSDALGVDLKDAVGTHKRPILAARQDDAAKLRPFECSAGHIHEATTPARRDAEFMGCGKDPSI